METKTAKIGRTPDMVKELVAMCKDFNGKLERGIAEDWASCEIDFGFQRRLSIKFNEVPSTKEVQFELQMKEGNVPYFSYTGRVSPGGAFTWRPKEEISIQTDKGIAIDIDVLRKIVEVW